MAQNIRTIVELNPNVGCYTPIIEAIVNSIESIQLSGRIDGKIDIEIIRAKRKQKDVFTDQEQTNTTIQGFRIIDNGIGFNDDTTDSYDEPFTDAKFASHNCKGYGRFTALKIFNKILIDSVYRENNGIYYKRSLRLDLGENRAEGRNIIAFEEHSACSSADNVTQVLLEGIKHNKNKFDSNASTISKRIFESLLPYFLRPPYEAFPQITMIDGDESVNLNEFMQKTKHVINHSEREFSLESSGTQYDFKVDFILMHGSQSGASSIMLTANNREVTSIGLSSYVPEFQPGLKNIDDENPENLYYIKAIVSSIFLDENVNFQREKFNFPNKAIKGDVLETISKNTLENQVAKIAVEDFQEIFEERQLLKNIHIIDIVNTELPYYQRLLKNIDIVDIPYDISANKLAQILNEKQFKLELDLRYEIESFKFENIQSKESYEKLCAKLNDLQKDNLTHYMVFRKLVMDNLGKLLEYSYQDAKFEVEDTLHSLIFPIKTETNVTDYDDHNLWILDERLTFNKYVISDISIFNDSKQRIDLAIFDNKTFYREDNDESTPCVVYEFKRPGDKLEKKDHVAKLMDYLNDLRNNKIKRDYKKRQLNIGPTTPLFGYLVADINNDIIKLLERYGFIRTADGKGYYLWHPVSKAYIEFLTWDKVKEDVQKRHKAFFHKLGI